VPGSDTTNFFADNYFGLAVRVENQFLTFQVTTFQSDVSTVDSNTGPGALNTDGTGTLSVASLSWDVNNIVGYAEFTTRDLKAGSSALPIDALFPDQDAYYITLGYRMNKYLPHITFATADASPIGPFVPNNGGPSQGVQQESITLGLRYELNDSAALKMEYAIIELDNVLGNRGLFQPTLTSGLDNSKTNLISVAVDVIF